MKAKFLVCRNELIRRETAGTLMSGVRSSDYFPMVVEVDTNELDPATFIFEQVLEIALDAIDLGYRSEHEYLITPLDEAVVIQRRPKRPEFEYRVRSYV